MTTYAQTAAVGRKMTEVTKADYKATKTALALMSLDGRKLAAPAAAGAGLTGSYQLGRRNGKKSVSKGFLRQGVMPKLARRKGAAGTLAKPKDVGSTKPAEISPGITYLGPGQVGMRGVRKGVLAEVGAKLTGTTAPTAMTPPAAAGGLKAVKSATTPAKTLAGTGAKKPVAKRRFDPEDERRHRQGFQAGAGATGGAVLTGYGVRGVRRDTKELFNTPDVDPGKEPKRLGSWGGTPYEELSEAGRKKIDERYAKESAHHSGAKAISALKGKKGLLVRAKPAAMLGGGLATLGLAAGHQARRHESRYD